MEGKLQLRIEFLDGTVYAEDVGMTYGPGDEDLACLKLLADMKAVGGLIQKGSGHSITLRTWNSMRTISIEAPSSVGGDLTDLSRLGGESRIKLA